MEPFGSFLGAAGSVASLASLVAIWRGERSGLLRLALGTIFLLAGFSSYSSYVYYEETKPAAVRQARQVELREAVQKFLSDNSAVPSNIDSGHNYGIVQGGLILLELYKDVIPDSYKHFRDEAHESISFGKSHMDAAAQAKSSSIAAQSMLTTLRLVAGGG